MLRGDSTSGQAVRIQCRFHRHWCVEQMEQVRGSWGGHGPHISAGNTAMAVGVCGFLRGTLEGTPSAALRGLLRHSRSAQPESTRRGVGGRTHCLPLRGGSAAWFLRGRSWAP